MRVAVAILGVLLVAAGTVAWFKIEHQAPRVALSVPVDAIGRSTPIDLVVHAGAPGLRAVTVTLQTANGPVNLASEPFPKSGLFGSGITEKRFHVVADVVGLKVPEGAATLEVLVETHAWRFGRAPRTPQLVQPVSVDLTPPRLDLLTTQHNARLGGVELVVFRQAPDTVRSGVAVDRYFFPSVTGYFTDPTVALAFFAIPQDLTAAVRPQLVASDGAGNERQVALPVTIKPRKFADRSLAVDDDFLARKVPEIQHDNKLPPAADFVQGYLAINGDLRRQNEARIREVTAASARAPQWTGVFHRQSNAAPLSAFADRRAYTYNGEVIDHQTHLGYDLASLKASPVEAAQAGTVVFAENLGIYGNTVILDHGLGIFSLYGHLSAVAVRPGERVTVGQTLGQTGQTGLAAGDHLHFSILLSGVHVDPVEWWDAHWLRDHVTSKLTMFPRPAGAAADATVATEPPKHEQGDARPTARAR